MPPSSSIGGNMPSANQSRWPDVWNRFSFVMCGRVHELVAGRLVALARVVLHDLADEAALRVQDREPGPDLLREREEVELEAELAVVALLGLLEAVQVVVERRLRLPRGAVDALEHRRLLVAAPVRARDLRELERAEPLRARHVRAAAEVDELGLPSGRGFLYSEITRPLTDLSGVVGVDPLDDLALVRLVGRTPRARCRGRPPRARTARRPSRSPACAPRCARGRPPRSAGRRAARSRSRSRPRSRDRSRTRRRGRGR